MSERVGKIRRRCSYYFNLQLGKNTAYSSKRLSDYNTRPYLQTNHQQHALYRRTSPSFDSFSFPIRLERNTRRRIKAQKMFRCSWFCRHFTTLSLSILLFLQFGVEFQVQNQETAYLQWSVVNLSIALFTVASFLLKETLAEIDSLALTTLLPEAIVLAVSGLISYGQLVMGFLVLLAGMLCVAVGIVAICAYQLFSIPESTEPKEKDYK